MPDDLTTGMATKVARGWPVDVARRVDEVILGSRMQR